MPRDRRGQLLLVAALGLALAFVALALVLNTVVFTENLATRNHDRADDVIGFQNAVEDGVGGLLAEVNRQNDTDYESLSDAFQEGLAAWDENATVLSAANGRVTSVNVTSLDNGTRILQEETDSLDDGNGSGDWTMARDVEDVRRFVLVVDPAEDPDPSVTITDGDATWTVEVAGEDDDDDTTVTVSENGSQVASTNPEDDEVVIDFTAGRVDGEPVEGWSFAEGVSEPYDVEISEGEDAMGRYELVVDEPKSSLDTEAPDTRHAIYSADVAVTVRESSLTYETNVTVAPEDGIGTDEFVA